MIVHLQGGYNVQHQSAVVRWSAPAVAAIILFAASARARGETFSYTGTLASPTSVEQFTFTLNSTATVSLQTFGFGGGSNAAGTVIPAGGTDPFLALFSGTGDSATIVTDALANPYGTSLILTNYGNPDFAGCGVGQANAPTIGGAAQCGDIYMSLALEAGEYMVILSDGQYIANAVFDNGTLGEGFTDFTGGIFCNAVINGVDCANNSGAYALDITLPNQQTPGVPEPATVTLLASGVAFGWWRRKRAC